MTFHPDSLGDLSGRVYVVTGGNAGIGYYSALHLAAHHAKVYLCARSPTKAADAISSIKTLHPTATLHHLPIDHLSLRTVVAAASHLLATEPQLHGLLNNAGIMAVPFALSPTDGYESEWQTNYLAHWLLTSLLLPRLLATSRLCAPGVVRVVNLTSSGHFGAPWGGINFEDLSNRDGGAWSRYGQSKLANVLHTKTLHALHGPGSKSALDGEGEIWTAAVHPGLVESQLASRAGPSFAKMHKVLLLLRQYIPADEGSYTSLFALASPDFTPEQSGRYFERVAKLGWESCRAKDAALAERLEAWTKEEMERGGWIGCEVRGGEEEVGGVEGGGGNGDGKAKGEGVVEVEQN